MTHTPASGPLELATTPPMSSLSMCTASLDCATPARGTAHHAMRPAPRIAERESALVVLMVFAPRNSGREAGGHSVYNCRRPRSIARGDRRFFSSHVLSHDLI